MEQLIDINGARLRVRSAGKGPAVLFIHGWALDLDMWTPQFKTFASSHQCIAFDRRGFGLSTGSPGIEYDVDDIDTLLARLRIGQATLIGMSQGVRAATRWALKNQRRVSRIVLDGVPCEGQQEIPVDEYRELARREGLEAVRRRWLEHPLMQLHGNDAAVRALLQKIVERYPGRDLAVNEPLSPVADLSALDVPVLVVNGEHDTEQRRAAGAALASALVNASHALIPQAGHLPNLDNAPAYDERLTNFLREPANVERAQC